MADPNKGEMGRESLRLNGLRVGNLPVGEAARAVEQLPAVEKTERENKIDAIKARYPAASVEYLESRIQEARHCATQFKLQKKEVDQRLAEYRVLAAQCEMRDKELEPLEPGTDEHKAMKKKYPPYDVEGLRKQIEIDLSNLERYDEVVEKEHNSIVELTETITLVQRRDAEIRALGG